MSGEGWVSSGGELLKDGQNPWWVKNTRTVRYCIAVDEQSISARKERLFFLVEKAIAYWKKQLMVEIRGVRYAKTINAQFHLLGVGEQEFELVTCNGTEDLKVQFGHGTLSPEQLQYIQKPESYVAITARTEYDEAQLHGRGFIYIASDLGPHRYDVGADLIERPWEKDLLIFAILTHEMGHVFGIPHVGDPYTLMSAQFPEWLLNKALARLLLKIKAGDELRPPSFFIPDMDFKHCFPEIEIADRTREFFGMEPTESCIYFTFSSERQQYAVNASPTEESPLRRALGVIKDLDLVLASHNTINLKLNPRQQVFPGKAESPVNWITGPFIATLSGTGAFYPGRKEPKSLSLSLEGPYPLLRISGNVQGKVQLVIGDMLLKGGPP